MVGSWRLQEEIGEQWYRHWAGLLWWGPQSRSLIGSGWAQCVKRIQTMRWARVVEIPWCSHPFLTPLFMIKFLIWSDFKDINWAAFIIRWSYCFSTEQTQSLVSFFHFFFHAGEFIDLGLLFCPYLQSELVDLCGILVLKISHFLDFLLILLVIPHSSLLIPLYFLGL